MLVVGLTGGIGSGKSAAAAQFSALGVTVVNADIVAREVVEPGTEALQRIAEHFGADCLLDDGSLDRAKLRDKVFADQSERIWLEQLTHPLIGMRIFELLNAELREGEAPYRILESPLLMETAQKDLTDRLLLIDVSEATQIARTMARDNNSEAQVKAIIAAQMPRQEKLALADDIVDNNGTLEALQSAVLTLHESYLNLSKHTTQNANNPQ